MTTKKKSTMSQQLRLLRDGLAANLNDVASVTLGQTTYTPAALVAQIDAFLAVQAETVDQESKLALARSNEKASNARAAKLRSQVQAYLVSRHGRDSPALYDYGFAPVKVPEVTAASKAIAAEKQRRTRRLRYPYSKGELARIQGVVDPGVVASLTGRDGQGNDDEGGP